MRLIASLAATALLVGACGGTAAAPSPSPTVAPTTAAPTPTPSPTPQTKFTFVTDLKSANEVPPVSNAEAVCSGKGTFTLNTTKDATGTITAATGSFEITVTGCPANTPIILWHVHKAAAGVAGGVVVPGKTDAANPIVLASGATTSALTTANVTVDPALAKDIIAGPTGFYINVHSTTNPGGVIRGQLNAG